MQKVYIRKLEEARHKINSVELIFRNESGVYESENLMIALPHIVVASKDFDDEIVRYER